MKHVATALALAIAAQAACAAEVKFVGKPDCRVADLEPDTAKVEVTWDGACSGGYAEGEGKLEVVRNKKVLVRYVGTLRGGVPEGAGYMARHDGTIYEGEFKGGIPDGKGVESTWLGQYEGEYRAGSYHGYGRATFTLGGSYDGQWREGKFHGKGTAVYTSGRVFTGEFVDGRAAGAPPPATSEAKYKLSSEKPLAGWNRPGVRVVVSNLGVPYDRGYDEMTPAQQAVVRSWYPLLDKDDEPPYPADDTEDLWNVFAEGMRASGEDGVLRMLIDVDSRGKVTNVAVIQTPNKGMARVAMTTMLGQRFKPARCAGQPCAMKYPFQAHFVMK